MANLGGIGRELASNASAIMQDLYKFGKDLPLLGVTKKGQNKIGARAGDIAEAFSPETKAFREATSNKVNSINDEGGILDQITKNHNSTNGLTGDAEISRDRISSDITKAHHVSGEKERAEALSKVRSDYGIGEDHMNTIGSTIADSKKLAGTYEKAAKAPFGMAKDYFMDGSPLATYAKVATVATAAQMIGGSRTSLTEKNGQRDIAGIPFI